MAGSLWVSAVAVLDTFLSPAVATATSLARQRPDGAERGDVMAPRAYWKGYLKLSLVSCPIALYPAASSSERVSFNRINKKTGNRLKQQQVDAETGQLVEKEDIIRGYEVGKGQYLQVPDEDIEKIQIESTHTIDINSFVPRAEIDERYLDSPYYICLLYTSP